MAMIDEQNTFTTFSNLQQLKFTEQPILFGQLDTEYQLATE